MAGLRLVEDSDEDGQGGDPGSLDDVVRDYMPLVRHVVNRLTTGSSPNTILDHEDLLSFGVQGLIEAYHGFDSTRGAKFSTFAVPRIRGAILDAIRAAHPLSRSLQRLSATIDRTTYELTMELGHSPARSQVACRLGMSEFELAQASRMTNVKTLSLEGMAEISDGGILDRLAEMSDGDANVRPEVVIERHLSQREVSAAIESLPARERLVVNLYYIQMQPLKAIAGLLDLSESRVSQLRHRAVRRLQEMLLPHLPEAA